MVITKLSSTTQQHPQVRKTLSDVELLALCSTYGSQAKLWKQKFLGLLPEVNNRRLYEQKGCLSIFEFAAKLGGVSREQVQRVLQLNDKFALTPALNQALTSGDISVSKLARVASIATLENQDFLVAQSKLLSNRALETLVKDLGVAKSVHVHTFRSGKIEKVGQSDELELSLEVRQRLVNLQNKGINVNEILEQFLDQRESQIQQKKELISEELKKRKDEVGSRQRYIPAKIRQILQQEFGKKCAYKSCVNTAMNIHHTKRFSLDPSHNPFYLAPLCKQHHEIAHSIDLKVVTKRRQIVSESP